MRRVVFLLSLVAAGVFAASAGATKPVITHFTDTSPFTLSGVCSFNVSVSATVRGTEIDYFDANGALTRVYVHVVEQDTFSANGKEITGEPFTFNIEILFDADGNVTHVFASGLVEKIILPDGTFFLSAGRLDFIAHPGADFLISPDVGNPGNVAAFCAALSQGAERTPSAPSRYQYESGGAYQMSPPPTGSATEARSKASTAATAASIFFREQRRGTRRMLWREVPIWLMETLHATVPPDDRTGGRRLFPDLNEGRCGTRLAAPVGRRGFELLTE